MNASIANLWSKEVGMRHAFASIAKETSWLLEGFESDSIEFRSMDQLIIVEGGRHNRDLRCGDKWSGS